MTLASENTALELPITVENDLEVDNNGLFHVVTYLFPSDSDDSVEIRILFEEIIDNLINFYREDLTPSGYGQIYMIANELERHKDNLRSIADNLEGKHLNEELFDDLEDPIQS